MLTVGNKLPQFSVQACVGSTPDDLREITNETYAGKWLVLLFYPKDFTFICPTELVALGEQLDEFTEREAVVLGGSTDNEYSHLAWRQSHPQLNELPYPLIAAQRLAADLGILDPLEHVCLRAAFLVDPEGMIQWVGVNNLNKGRSVEEVLRVLQAVQSSELTACNWQPGQKYVEA